MRTVELTDKDLRNLENKIKNKTAEIGVVGLGYVGLPLALAFAEAGFYVTGIDTEKSRVNKITRGISYLLDIESPRLKKAVRSGHLKTTTSQSVLRRMDRIIICVPTPLTKTKEPDLTYIINAGNEMSAVPPVGASGNPRKHNLSRHDTRGSVAASRIYRAQGRGGLLPHFFPGEDRSRHQEIHY